MSSKLKAFYQLHIWPFWGLGDTSSNLHFDEKGKFISADPSTWNDHVVRLANRKKLKERGGVIHYLINWIAMALLFLTAGSLAQSWSQTLYIILFFLFLASSLMSVFLALFLLDSRFKTR